MSFIMLIISLVKENCSMKIFLETLSTKEYDVDNPDFMDIIMKFS